MQVFFKDEAFKNMQFFYQCSWWFDAQEQVANLKVRDLESNELFSASPSMQTWRTGGRSQRVAKNGGTSLNRKVTLYSGKQIFIF